MEILRIILLRPQNVTTRAIELGCYSVHDSVIREVIVHPNLVPVCHS